MITIYSFYRPTLFIGGFDHANIINLLEVSKREALYKIFDGPWIILVLNGDTNMHLYFWKVTKVDGKQEALIDRLVGTTLGVWNLVGAH